MPFIPTTPLPQPASEVPVGMLHYHMYTDGGCNPNPGPGAFAVIVLDERQQLLSQFAQAEGETTNNRMELMAMEFALARAAVSPEIFYTITTDSQYVKKGLTEWLPGWKKKNWRTSAGGDVLNKDLWIRLDEIYQTLTNIRLEWVKGHSKHQHNDLVDSLCTEAIIKLKTML